MTTAKSKLAESGLSIKDARALGIEERTPEETAGLCGHYAEVQSLFIPYYGLNGERVTDMHRVRYLEETPGFSRGRKYDQPEGLPPHVYLPKPLPWAKIAADPRVPVYITEGELKAACGWKNGLAVIGLGGVWSWRTKKLGLEMLPALEEFDWSGRSVRLVFDSDVAFNADVRVAIQSLGRALGERGAEVTIIRLPQEDGKLGLDDYLVAYGRKAFDALDLYPVFEDQQRRDEIFAEWVYVASDDHVVDLRGDPYVTYTSRQHFMNATQHEKLFNMEGNLVPAARLWYDDPGRIIVPRYVMEPTDERRIIPGKGLNRYRGLGLTPKQGKVEPMLTLIDAIVGGSRKTLRTSFLQWLAYPLQNPGAKVNWTVLVYHHLQGCGKTSIGEIMLDIYGRGAHGLSLTEEDFFGDWNEWTEMGLFCLCDDLSFGGDKKSRHRLKNKITEEYTQLYAKYRKAVQVRNLANFYFTSNSAGALPLDQGSNRRVCVIEVQKILDRAWFETVFHNWRHHEDGPAAFAHYLMHKVDCSDFNPKGWAPETDEKELAVESSGTSLELWLKDALDRHFKTSPVWTMKQIMTIYEMDTGDKKSRNGAVSRGLQAVGASRYPKQIEINGMKETLWCLGDDDAVPAARFMTMTPANAKKLYERYFPDLGA